MKSFGNLWWDFHISNGGFSGGILELLIKDVLEKRYFETSVDKFHRIRVKSIIFHSNLHSMEFINFSRIFFKCSMLISSINLSKLSRTFKLQTS